MADPNKHYSTEKIEETLLEYSRTYFAKAEG